MSEEAPRERWVCETGVGPGMAFTDRDEAEEWVKLHPKCKIIHMVEV